MDNNLTNITKKVIEQQSQAISAEVSSKLNQARHKAIQAKQNKFARFTLWFMPVTAITVMAAYLLLPILQGHNDQQRIPEDNFAVIQDMEIIEQMDLIESLEFYEWLSQDETLTSI